MTNGVSCDFTPINEEQRASDVEAAISRGNHKSAQDREDLLNSLVHDDIVAGFQLPIPIDSTKLIVNGMLAPCGIVDQFSINELGERIEKNRLTHDQSFDFSEGNSPNSRLIRDDLPELRYGACLSQIIHYAHALRFAYPRKKIVASKTDLKSAYRRAHLLGPLAAMALTIVGYYALLSLQLTFGGAYCPFF